jgi:hypothetical protein
MIFPPLFGGLSVLEKKIEKKFLSESKWLLFFCGESGVILLTKVTLFIHKH